MKQVFLLVVSLVFWRDVMGSSNARMGGSVVDFIEQLELAGDLNHDQAQFIETRYPNADESDHYQSPETLERDGSVQHEVTAYLDEQEAKGELMTETRLYVSSLLELETSSSKSVDPVAGNYDGLGIVELLGRSSPSEVPLFTFFTRTQYMGIWGYAAGIREYALVCHSDGFHIVDVTDPASNFRVQYIPMDGGILWRDVETHRDEASGDTYAYVGAQAGGNLFVVNLSFLSDSDPHDVDGANCPFVDRGFTNYAHTLSVRDGLLFLNSAGDRILGCQMFDLTADPWNPRLLPNAYNGTQRDCHDSFARSGMTIPGVAGLRTLLYSADGWTRSFRIVDITAVREGGDPVLVGQTEMEPLMFNYAHSLALSEDSKYLYTFDEMNVLDITIYDVSDPRSPTFVRSFAYSEQATLRDSAVHNGHVRGNYLFVAYYEAGFRLFDISDPINPVEVGKHETYLDPDGTGEFPNSSFWEITGGYRGAWNLYPYLPSGNVLVTDMQTGLHILRINEDQVCQDIEGWNTQFGCGTLEALGCQIGSFLPGNVPGMTGQASCCVCGGGEQ